MIHKAVQVRIYPSKEQETQLAQSFGCARWWWNYALNKSIETYKETSKGLSRAALNALLPILKKAEDTITARRKSKVKSQKSKLILSKLFGD